MKMGAIPGKLEFIELKLEDAEFGKIKSIVYDRAGISLAESKRALVVSRLTRRLRQLNLRSFPPYIHILESDPREIHVMINQITTNLTRFFREKHQFEVLRNQVLPHILENKKKKGEKTLRIWSAGCSTGEEVYSILFEVADLLKSPHLRKQIPMPLDWKILGSDIDTEVLTRARSGLYTAEEMKDLENNTKEMYFDRISPTEFKIKDEFKKFVLFKRINLVYDPFEFKHKVDIIFCRNVVIYFNNDTRQKVYEKFHAVLNEPGFFFSGHSENLFKFGHVFKLVEKSIYKKVG